MICQTMECHGFYMIVSRWFSGFHQPISRHLTSLFDIWTSDIVIRQWEVYLRRIIYLGFCFSPYCFLFLVPSFAMLLCFFASLLLCFCCFSASLLFCLSVSLFASLLLLFCCSAFTCFSALLRVLTFLLLWFFASLLPCFFASLLFCVLLFPVFPCFTAFSCFSASLLPCFFAFLCFLLFCFSSFFVTCFSVFMFFHAFSQTVDKPWETSYKINP